MPVFRTWSAVLLFGAMVMPHLEYGQRRASTHTSTAPDQLTAADSQPQNWLTYGRTYNEQRFSPLHMITAKNVDTLGLAWFQDLGMHRGEEATPLVVDGVIYISTAWSVVWAFDAATGAPLWTYDPKVPRDVLAEACCDAVSRGLAYANGVLFDAALDGRLIAISAKSGHMIWFTRTFEPGHDYTLTGAARVVKNLVIIGNGGADLGVRGYVSAYNVDTGKLAWRFYTVPGDPHKPAESPILNRAMKTWKGDVWWKGGGGGTVWDAIAYDPDLDLLYIGTGNGGPWNQADRSPGGGDNLFLASIVALRPETGEYVWHYQENPGEEWDYTATQPIMLADLDIDGHRRKVLMQAPKNGFFYVLDRANGKLLSAKNFVPVNWATGIDLKTGRPMENPAARYDVTGKPFLGSPSSRGGHSWMPMSYSPLTGLVYIPAQETSQLFEATPDYHQKVVGWNLGISLTAERPSGAPPSRSYLLAWDPVAQKERWRVPYNRASGGVLSTASNLLVQGEADGHLNIYRAEDGTRLWRSDTQSMTLAGPITYEVAGQQYIAVMSGCGGDFAGSCGLVNRQGQAPILDRLLVYKLGGNATLPAKPDSVARFLHPSQDLIPAAVAKRGRTLYDMYCVTCHGDHAVSPGLNPDLRYSAFINDDGFYKVVLDGMLKNEGMVSFARELSHDDAAAIRGYIVSRAQADQGAAAK